MNGNFCFFCVEREVCFVFCITGLVECHNRTFHLEAMKHFRLLISLLLRHGPQKQGEDLIPGGRKVGESVNKVVRIEDLITTSVKMAM